MSQYSDQLADEIQAQQVDNIETLKGVGEGRRIEHMEQYHPSQRVGVENDFSRDLAADGAKRSTQHGGSATESIVDALPPAFMVERHTGAPAPKPDGTVDNPAYIFNAPSRRIMTGQYAMSVNTVQVLFTTPERMTAIIKNTDATNPIYIGGLSAMTAATGFPLKAGESITLSVDCEIWATAPTGNPIIAIIEFLV